MNLDPGSLTPGQLDCVKAIRNAIPDPGDGDWSQRVIPEGDISKYLSNDLTGIRGFVTKGDDVADLTTKGDIIEGLRLDPWSQYTSGDYVGVLEFPKTADFDVHKAFGTNVDPDAFLDPSEYVYPFSGNGFTTTRKGKVVPEYHLGIDAAGDHVTIGIPEGTELFSVDTIGTKSLLATFTNGEWVQHLPFP